MRGNSRGRLRGALFWFRIVMGYMMDRQEKGEVATGLLYIDTSAGDVHDMNKTVATPLAEMPFEDLCPGSAALDKLQAGFR